MGMLVQTYGSNQISVVQTWFTVVQELNHGKSLMLEDSRKNVCRVGGHMTFDDMLAEEIKDPEFRKEFETLEAEYTIRSTILRARKERNMTQEQRSNVTGVETSPN